MFIPFHKKMAVMTLSRRAVHSAVLFSVALLLLAACASAPAPKAEQAGPELTFLPGGSVEIGFSGAVLTNSVEFYNPNREPLRVERGESVLTLGGERVLSRTDGGFTLAGGERRVLPLAMDLSFAELYRDFPLLGDAEEAAWQIGTDCHWTSSEGESRTVSAGEQGVVSLVRKPRFDFESLYVKSLGLMGADIIILMKTENPNSFAVNMDALRGVLRVNEQRWTELESGKSVELPAGSVSDLGFQFRLEFLSMGRTVRDLLSRQEALDYLFGGDMTLSSSRVSPGGEDLPLRFSGDVEIIHPDTTGGAHSSAKIENSIESNLINIFGRYR